MKKLTSDEINCFECSETNCFIKKYANKESIEEVIAKKETAFYRLNQHIIYKGNPVMGLYFVQQGKIKVLSSGLDRRTHIVRLTKEGGIIGHRGYGEETYPISAIAIEESIICFVDNATIYEVFMNNPKFTFQLMMYYAYELRKSESRIKAQAQMNVREKVAESLISYNNLYNTKSVYPYLLPTLRKDIADFAGINTEQLSRIITEFKDDNVVAIENRNIIINDIAALKSVIEPFDLIE